jgi:hypothetical protein
MSSDRQELIRRFAEAIAGEYFAILADAEPPQPPADNRIDRALQVLREAQAYDWIEAEVLSEVRKILESTP